MTTPSPTTKPRARRSPTSRVEAMSGPSIEPLVALVGVGGAGKQALAALAGVPLGGDGLERVAELLGGRRVFTTRLSSAMDAHDALHAGLPGRAVTLLVSKLTHLDLTSSAVTTALGMSVRTYQRWKDTPEKPLSSEQSGRAWKFAEILARATQVFGGQPDAERWLEEPATGLEQRRPIDLLGTPAGVELVEDHLTRLEYGVYA